MQCVCAQKFKGLRLNARMQLKIGVHIRVRMHVLQLHANAANYLLNTPCVYIGSGN